MRRVGLQIKRFVKNCCGATAIEYGLIAGLIAIAIVGGANAIGSSTNSSFNAVSEGVWDTTS